MPPARLGAPSCPVRASKANAGSCQIRVQVGAPLANKFAVFLPRAWCVSVVMEGCRERTRAAKLTNRTGRLYMTTEYNTSARTHTRVLRAGPTTHDPRLSTIGHQAR